MPQSSETKPLINRIKVTYFSDPVCSTCWIVDPYIKKLMREYGRIIDIDIVMGGLLKDWSEFCKPSESASKEYLCNLWEREEKSFGIRLDNSIWQKTPVRSSTPASIAYYAAQMQHPKLADQFMRNVREMLFLRGKDISQNHHLRTAAIEAKIDIHEFMENLDNSKALAIFESKQHLRTKWFPQYYPTLIFENSDGDWKKGMDPVGDFSLEEMYAGWEQILNELTIGTARKIVNTYVVHDILKSHGRLSMYELRVLTNQPETVLRRQIRQSLSTGQIVTEMIGNMTYYRYNDTPFAIQTNGMQIKDATILGGGVAGQFLKLGLHKCDVKTTLYERQKKEGFKGFGFILLKNGIDALDVMGLKNELYRKGNVINFFKAIDIDGNTLFYKELDNCLAISREDYFSVMETKPEVGTVFYQSECSDWKIDTEKRTCTLTKDNGESVHSDVIFAADGIRSMTRNSMFPTHQPTIVDEREIIGSVNMPGLAIETDTFLKVIDAKEGRYFGLLPLGNDEYIWFLQLNPKTHPVEDPSPQGLREFVLNAIQTYPAMLIEIVEQSDFNKVFLWTAHRMDLLPAFHRGNTVLLGDAAHPFLALTSQGANCALEDAAFLLTLLSAQTEDESLEDVFMQYYLMRKEAIQHHIHEGDILLKDFLQLRENGSFRLPLSIH